jgi:DNA-binding transcriptional ArsR family regulator
MVEEMQEFADARALLSAMEQLDETIHQKVRMGIMSLLMARGECDFRLLRDLLKLSDGNLSTHLSLLDERGYVQVVKEFRGKRPHTRILPTTLGAQRFREYLNTLERIVRRSDGGAA